MIMNGKKGTKHMKKYKQAVVTERKQRAEVTDLSQ